MEDVTRHADGAAASDSLSNMVLVLLAVLPFVPLLERSASNINCNGEAIPFDGS